MKRYFDIVLNKLASHKKFSFTLLFIIAVLASLLPFEIFSSLGPKQNSTQTVSSLSRISEAGSGSSVICKDAGGVDSSTLPNGYVYPICMTSVPTSSNYTNGQFNSTKAKATPNPYKDGKYYDVYKCVTANTYDFAPKSGVSDVCNKYPWLQNSSGTLPTPPPGSTCKDPTPYWDGSKCTFRPDACNNVGITGKNNTCQATACDAAHKPDTLATQAEANLACKTFYGDAKGFCCLQGSTGGSTPTPTPTSAATPTPTPTPSSGGTGTEFDHCYHGDIDCAPQYKCSSNPGTATSHCVYRDPRDTQGDPYCKYSLYHCEGNAANPSAHPKCDVGTQASPLGHSYSCQRAGLGSICCTGASTASIKVGSSTASFGNSVNVGTCTSNLQCVKSKLGTACVYTNSDYAGVCR